MKCGKDKTPTHTQFNGMVAIFKCAKKKKYVAQHQTINMNCTFLSKFQ